MPIVDDEDYYAELVDQIIYDSYLAGPIYEAIRRDDKETIKNITNRIRPQLEEKFQKDSTRFCKAHRLQSVMMNSIKTGLGLGMTVASNGVIGIASSAMSVGKSALNLVKDIKNMISIRAYQLLGICSLEPNEVKQQIQQLNKEYGDKLGQYRIIGIPVMPEVAGIINYFKTDPFDDKTMLMLVVDKDRSNYTQDDQKKIAQDIKEVENNMIEESVGLSPYNIDLDDIFDEQDIYEAQDSFTEMVISEAIFDSYLNGPIFEKVSRSDKETVKQKANTLRPKIEQFCKDNSLPFCKAHRVEAMLRSVIGFALGIVGAIHTGTNAFNAALSGAYSSKGAEVTNLASAAVSGGFLGWNSVPLVLNIFTLIKTRSWQILGVTFFTGMNGEQEKETIEALNKQYQKELNGYKIIPFYICPGVAGLFNKDSWKPLKNMFMKDDNKKVHACMLIVDKEVPSEVKKDLDGAEKELKKAIKDKKVKTESADEFDLDLDFD